MRVGLGRSHCLVTEGRRMKDHTLNMAVQSSVRVRSLQLNDNGSSGLGREGERYKIQKFICAPCEMNF